MRGPQEGSVAADGDDQVCADDVATAQPMDDTNTAAGGEQRGFDRVAGANVFKVGGFEPVGERTAGAEDARDADVWRAALSLDRAGFAHDHDAINANRISNAMSGCSRQDARLFVVARLDARQTDAEDGAAARSRPKGQFATVGSDDIARDIEPQAEAILTLGGEEGLENPGRNVLVDADAVVLYNHGISRGG